MQRVFPSLLVVAGAIAACSAREPTTQGYVPPSGVPAEVVDALVPQPPALVWTRLLEHLERSPLDVDQADAQRGLIVVTDHGDPEPYVDCGWIVSYGPAGLQPVAGSIEEAVFDGPASDRGSFLRRGLDLDARTAVRLRASGNDTLVSVASIYVLTKTVVVEDPSGQTIRRGFEVVSFPSGHQGKFSKGTVCQPTGKLELTVLEALPSATTVAGPGSPTRSVGATPSEGVFACDGAEAFYCEALDVTAPYRQANEEQQLGLKLETVGPDGSLLHEGDVLTLDISFPTYDSYLQVAYLQRNGTVGHVMPGDQLWPANAANYVERTRYEIAEPYGIEMILAVATEEPLFVTSRPTFERAQDYLAALRRRLDELKAANPETRISASRLLVRTAPREAASVSF